MTYDPVDDVISILNNNWDSSISKPNIIKAYNIRAVDLRRGDYIIVGQVSEADDYVGIPLEFRRTAVISIMVKTKTSRERVREIAEEVRSISFNSLFEIQSDGYPWNGWLVDDFQFSL